MRGRSFSRHREVRAALHRDLVNTNEWDAQRGKDYDFLMDLRETGDYGGLAHASVESAQQAVLCACAILNTVLAAEPALKSAPQASGD